MDFICHSLHWNQFQCSFGFVEFFLVSEFISFIWILFNINKMNLSFDADLFGWFVSFFDSDHLILMKFWMFRKVWEQQRGWLGPFDQLHESTTLTKKMTTNNPTIQQTNDNDECKTKSNNSMKDDSNQNTKFSMVECLISLLSHVWKILDTSSTCSSTVTNLKRGTTNHTHTHTHTHTHINNNNSQVSKKTSFQSFKNQTN
jgi:ABC-type nickel/cobalt efflux system permease component RcnA